MRKYSDFTELLSDDEIYEHVYSYLEDNRYCDDMPYDQHSLADVLCGMPFWDIFNMGKSSNVSHDSEYFTVGIYGVTGYIDFEEYFDTIIDADCFYDYCVEKGYIEDEEEEEEQ